MDRALIEGAVARAVYQWARPGGDGGFNESTTPKYWERQALAGLVTTELEKQPTDRETRVLRRKIKDLGRQLGKNSAKVYELRCQLAEARSMIGVDPRSYRANLDRMRAAEKRVAELEAQLQAQPV